MKWKTLGFGNSSCVKDVFRDFFYSTLVSQPQRHNHSLFSGGSRWTGVWLPSHLQTSQVLYPHSASHCVDTEMSAGDKWNDKFRGRCGGGVTFPRLSNNSSLGKNELKRGGWMTEREKETTSRHYLYDMSSLSSLPMVHCTPGCTNSSCIKRLSGRWAWRQIELRIAECIIARQVSYYQSPMRNLQGKGLECNYYLGAHQASNCEWLWHLSILTL